MNRPEIAAPRIFHRGAGQHEAIFGREGQNAPARFGLRIFARAVASLGRARQLRNLISRISMRVLGVRSS